MRKINLSNGETYGTNNSEGGLFRQSNDGSWNQWRGNSQTPYFKTPAAMFAWLMQNCASHFSQFDEKPTMVSAFGWE
ncbi:MAG TPA: hypothetical protein PLX39_15340 [Pyrinomonadaceae bacterium]|nr:hypothetical protein [Pyrinomonadaceae bacterium]